MANDKEIKTKIKSVKNTRKITKAMQMVAASKMKRAQDVVTSARPYAEKMSEILMHLAERHPEYRHPFLERRDVKTICVIVVTSDKGLCGGLNGNLLRELMHFIKENSDKTLKFITIGRKGSSFLKRLDIDIIADITGISEKPDILKLAPAVTIATKEFREGNVDKVICFYNRFVNTMSQKVTVETMIPIETENEVKKQGESWDYLYEPDAKEVLDTLVQRYLEAVLYEFALENAASEQSARMVAMKSASENAEDMIGELNLMYNKSRQATITTQLSEIVGGAAAISA